MDNFGDNFYFDVVAHDEISYEKYIWNDISLEEMANSAVSSHYWARFSTTIPENLDNLIKKEESRLYEIEAETFNNQDDRQTATRVAIAIIFGVIVAMLAAFLQNGALLLVGSIVTVALVLGPSMYNLDEHKKRMSYRDVEKQRETVDFLHDAKKSLLQAIVRNSY